MISNLNPAGEQEHAPHLKEISTASCALAICAAREYAVDFDPALTAEFRRHLTALQEALRAACTEGDIQAVQSSFRGELRAYRDQAQEWLARVRGDLQASAEAMQSLAEGLFSSGVDHEKRLRNELQTLIAAANGEDLDQMRSVIRGAAASISESHEMTRRANQLIVAQLNDEIRSLHREIDDERRAGYTDAASGAWNRAKCEQRLANLLEHGDAFCVIVARLSNLKHLQALHPRELVEDLLKAMVKRAGGIAGKSAAIGRWSEDEFVVILDLDPAGAALVSGQLATQLSSPYTIPFDAVSHGVSPRVETMVVDRPTGGDPDRFRHRLEQTGEMLRGA